ncbi:MAG TPA: lamin tail domain-containing protein, partial [Verrucomicrobiota bacterium]|nr:lamin tail domain-containing protein [Verrucomicrobiota bacterium]
ELVEFAPHVHIPASAMEPGKTYRVRARFRDNTGRTSHWSTPVEFTASAPSIQPLRDALRITEIMYHPAGNPDAEFIELQNIGWSSLNLTALRLAGGITYDFATADIGQLEAGQRLVIAKNPELIQAIPGGSQATVVGPWNGKLSNNGEAIRLETAWGETVFSVAYKGSWHHRTDGQGLSLVLGNPHSATAAWSIKSGWIPSLFAGGSPGRGDNELATIEPPLWINEMMSGNDGWIELFNPAGQDVNIGGWFLSDTATRLPKFRLPAGLIVPPAGFLLLEAKGLYGRADASDRFEIPPSGGSLFLSQIDTGYLTGLGAMASFGPFEGTASRGLKQSEENNGIMVSLSIPTPGKPNTSQTDSDSDGLPDDWELAYGLKPESSDDASDDPDGDGLTNLQEYICGTDPQKLASRLELAVVRDNIQLELIFQSQSNRTYVIESREHLGLGGWNTVHTLAPEAKGGEVVVRELIEKTQPERYFRLLVMP